MPATNTKKTCVRKTFGPHTQNMVTILESIVNIRLGGGREKDDMTI
jgi:hypothetical protein